MAIAFHNSGSVQPAWASVLPCSENTGVFEASAAHPAYVGKFKAPTLRNVAVTAPYMHDGSVATLEDAIDHYAAGGRTIATGANAGVGRDNPNKSSSIRGFALTQDQRSDLIAFLQSLTDEALLRDPRFGNPWVRRSDR